MRQSLCQKLGENTYLRLLSKKYLYIFLSLFSNIFEVSAQEQLTQEQLDKLNSVVQIINYAYVDSIKPDHLIENAITGLLEHLDPHSVFISKDELKEMNEPLEGNFEGIGIQFSILRDTINVVATVAGGPSEELGIKAGDKIIKIEGQTVAGIKIKNNDVMKKLRGNKGTRVTVSILRSGSNKLLDYTITRDKIPIYSVDASYMATPTTGYIKINRFAQTTMDELSRALESLSDQGAKDLILDLSDNGGGYLNIAIELADEFLENKKLIVYTEGVHSPKQMSYATSKGEFEKGKLVILIDESSASASEIVAGAVQDWDRGLIIGRRSFGKGLVQKPFPLADGSMIRLTTARYYTPVGRSIQKPYGEGTEDYYKDIYKRYTRGEFTNKDSIIFPDSLKFYTPNKRVVYGGGGIMPDIFVPLDTSKSTEYHTELLRKGIINSYSFNYIDRYRAQLAKQYPSFSEYEKGFKVDKAMLEELVSYAEKEGVRRDDKQFNISKDVIAVELKALIARDIWNNDSFYKVINQLNPAYHQALDILKTGNFKKLKINVN